MSNTFNLNNFNDLMNQANQLLTCGPSCMQQQKSQQLEQNYLDAETNMVNAPQKLFSAKKAYITYTQGETGYNDYMDKDLQEKADAIASAYQTKFNTDVSVAKNQINTYDGLVINFNNVVDLYKKYKRENNELEKKLKARSSDTLTNDRKTYYEDQGISRLKTYYYFLLFVYAFIVLVFLLAIFLVKTNVKITTRIFILFLLIIYPFVCIWVFHLLYKLFNYIKSYDPKNVYVKL
uniref:Uncharacterized protein n=1 Tax=viral metagenome TaxID=1070528 RepID=A0A6C0JK27_9ZZZZ